eukprot:2908112-Rhodomonas_salina.1
MTERGEAQKETEEEEEGRGLFGAGGGVKLVPPTKYKRPDHAHLPPLGGLQVQTEITLNRPPFQYSLGLFFAFDFGLSHEMRVNVPAMGPVVRFEAIVFRGGIVFYYEIVGMAIRYDTIDGVYLRTVIWYSATADGVYLREALWYGNMVCYGIWILPTDT